MIRRSGNGQFASDSRSYSRCIFWLDDKVEIDWRGSLKLLSWWQTFSSTER